jgi:hypothetical protein
MIADRVAVDVASVAGFVPEINARLLFVAWITQPLSVAVVVGVIDPTIDDSDDVIHMHGDGDQPALLAPYAERVGPQYSSPDTLQLASTDALVGAHGLSVGAKKPPQRRRCAAASDANGPSVGSH